MKYTQRQVKLFSPNVPLSYKALKGTIRPNISPPFDGWLATVCLQLCQRLDVLFILAPFLFKNRKKSFLCSNQ